VPYISEAQRERAKWLELAELVAQVRAMDGCSVEDAHAQIRAALRDGTISSLRWHPPPAFIPSGGSGVQLPAFAPPGASDHWLAVKIDWERSRVFDTFAQAERKLLLIELRRDYSDRELANLHAPRKSVWRHFMLDRHACESLWTGSTQPSTEKPASDEIGLQPMRRRGAYKVPLNSFLARRSLEYLQRFENQPEVLAEAFRDYARENNPALLKTFPIRLRDMEPEIKRHIKARARKGATTASNRH
jgi:hypothetical protein